jgi:DNA-binding MarR family transcriptional regulator
MTALDPLPPSAKLVHYHLEQVEAPQTQPDIADATHLSERTARYALDRLEDADLVTSRPDVTDARRYVYTLATD